MTNALIYDGIILLVLVWCALRGYRRGLILTVSSLVVLLCAIFGANILSTALTPTVSPIVAPKIEVFLEEQLASHLDGDTDATIESLLEGTQLEALLPYVDEDVLAQVGTNAEALATEVLSTVAEALAYGVVQVILWIVAFVVISAVLNIVARTLDLVAKLPVLNTLNTLGGLVAGFVKGAIVLYIALIFFGWLGYLPTADVAEQTFLYSRLMAYNPVVIAIL